MTVSSEITRIEGNIAAAYTAASAKGATLPATENSDNLATCIGTITGSSSVITSLSITPTTSAQTITAPSGTDGYSPVSVAAVTSSIDANIIAGNIKDGVTILGVTGNYTGGGSSGTSDVPLTRVTDDNNNEIGTWFMNFLDGNGNLYKVVLLDAQYRNNSTQWCSDKSATVTNLPVYADLKTSNVWAEKETATQNTQIILNYCNTGGYTSTACSHCRSKSFNVGGVTYYGQLPNTLEVLHIVMNYNNFDALDTSASSYSSLNFSRVRTIWASDQYNATNCWGLSNLYNTINNMSKTGNFFACPVLEIPISTTSKTYYAWWYGSMGLTLYTSEALPTTNSILYEINNNNVMEIASGIKLVNIASDGSNISIEVSGNTFTLDRYSSGDVSINYTPV